MKKLMLITVAVLILLVPVACARPAPLGPEPSLMPPPREDVYQKGVLLSGADEGAMAELRDMAGPAGPASSPADDRLIVHTGEMSLVVEDVVDARDEITDLAVGFGGFVVSSRILGEGMWGWITIRVPYDKFEQALAEFRGLATRVTSEGTSSRDVTEEYIDMESRLRNAEATENQFLALLEKADKVEDIVRIYDRLSRVRGEIEQIKGRMQYLERIVSMSLISVHLEPEFPARPLVRPGWSAVETLESAVRGFVIAGQWLGAIAIWLIIFIPLWGTVLGIIYYWRRRRRKTQAIL